MYIDYPNIVIFSCELAFTLVPIIFFFQPSGNLDGPEGGLDALLQAALCTKQLGWNKNARKIVLYTSDSGFHIAGDGKLGGLVERFEETCAMGKKPDSSLLYYLKSTKLDYPSVGQVSIIRYFNCYNQIRVYGITSSFLFYLAILLFHSSFNCLFFSV